MREHITHQSLPDVIGPRLEWILVGINPGLRSAEVGHHFAGPGNRFWDLLHDAGLTPIRLAYHEDGRLPEWGLGLTNIATRPTRSSVELRDADFARGRASLRRKITRFQPRGVAFVGITAYREFVRDGVVPGRIRCGLQSERIEGALVFVLPNPSGRNAHYSYREMLRFWRQLARLRERDSPGQARKGERDSDVASAPMRTGVSSRRRGRP